MFNLHNIELIYNSNTNFSGFNSLKDLIPIDFNEIAEKKVKMRTGYFNFVKNLMLLVLYKIP